MLAPHDRQLYSSLFIAPQEYEFDCAVGTTFSLDLESLLFVPYCIASQGGQPENAGAIALLEAIQRTAERVTVFCQDGETSAPEPPSAIYGLLEACIIPTRVRQGGALFHPKLWVIRFASKTEESPLLRVAVLSRNLTRSRAWDSIVCLHGSPTPARTLGDSAGLRGLLTALPELISSGGLSDERRQQINLLADEVGRTKFESPAPFTGTARFIASGLGEQSGFAPLEAEAKRTLAISPFVSSDTLRKLAELSPAGARTLIGRPEEMGRCDAGVIDSWQCWALEDGANPISQGDDPERDQATADAAPEGLHAKALALEVGKKTVWYLGSANLTDPVRSGAHVELMVRLVGPNKHVGIDAFLGDDKTGFQTLLRGYRHAAFPPDPKDGSRALVDQTKQAIVDAPLSVECLPAENAWSLELTGQVELPAGVAVRCRPVSLPAAHFADLGAQGARFPSLSIEALTGLFLFEVRAGSGDGAYELAFARKLPLGGLPPERDRHIARSIIKDRAAFLQYLRCLLADAGEPGTSTLTGRDAERQSAAGGATWFAAGLLEDLVKALHRDPKRLEGIKHLVAAGQLRFDSPSEEESVLPPEFLEVWSVFEDHLGRTSP